MNVRELMHKRTVTLERFESQTMSYIWEIDYKTWTAGKFENMDMDWEILAEVPWLSCLSDSKITNNGRCYRFTLSNFEWRNEVSFEKNYIEIFNSAEGDSEPPLNRPNWRNPSQGAKSNISPSWSTRKGVFLAAHMFVRSFVNVLILAVCSCFGHRWRSSYHSKSNQHNHKRE
jgi:hypothetical protein